MATTSFTLQDIAAAVADELQLSADDSMSVSQVTVAVTYSIDRNENRQQDFIDEWYEKYLTHQAMEVEVPF